MRQDKIFVNGCAIDLYSLNTIVVGSGAAGFNAVDSLYDLGRRDLALLTEGVAMGTSRNTGSDKQTYYKLTLAGGVPDSVLDVAQTLFAGGAMHGDLALCEAAGSAASFAKLAAIGVPFPHNRYGEYVGYRTDHDPRQRATSAGPLTSRFMAECLERRVKAREIPVFDGYKVIGIVTGGGVCRGLLALNKAGLGDLEKRFALFNCTNVVWATGGPAGLYACSVYPESQTGASGIAFEAGVRGRNLTEWQYGIASIRFRWNLSGSYQQVLPRYISTDAGGGDPSEFLYGHFPDATRMLTAIFLKGYQWPFDSRKVDAWGSSLIDILVHKEMQEKGRRVFLDFTKNPSVLASDFSNLGEEALAYLKNSGAMQPTPIERLAHLNHPAIDLYENNGIDLARERLEIAVCAQHNNGGLAVDCWWETDVRHFFAVGEAAGTHGVYRPGGSALNSGQVGSARAALYIAERYGEEPLPNADFVACAETLTAEKIALSESFLNNKTGRTPEKIRAEIGGRMSKHAAHIRSSDGVRKVREESAAQLKTLAGETILRNPQELVAAFENHDLLVAQQAYAAAMDDYIACGGGSRGSYLIYDRDGMVVPAEESMMASVQEVAYDAGNCRVDWGPVRPIPEPDAWFENVWREFRDDRSVR
ncbi:MAG: FAD-binding protein [Rikenellaceae bacterium]|jgi:succinate dehydrogenase/fumarate reductase flavoprotein subunit|nr:FAD-binding protein [Rikenellaceae bacterium]